MGKGGCHHSAGKRRSWGFTPAIGHQVRNSSLVFVLESLAIMVSVDSSIFCCTSARRKK